MSNAFLINRSIKQGMLFFLNYNLKNANRDIMADEGLEMNALNILKMSKLFGLEVSREKQRLWAYLSNRICSIIIT
jgi:hypothetical protein